jgi:hypothetical protein
MTSWTWITRAIRFRVVRRCCILYGVAVRSQDRVLRDFSPNIFPCPVPTKSGKSRQIDSKPTRRRRADVRFERSGVDV